MATNKLDELSINTIRFLAVDGVEKAKSGHPGMPMGDAAMAYALWSKHLRHNPKNPKWPGRDRFVLSAGHGSMLLYSLLHLTGYDLTLDDLKNFRQWGARTPGHPEYDLDCGIEMTTGPLGQGFATGVGMAMAERYLGERYNRDGYSIFDYNIYAIAGDGDIMEGVTNEAASMAGHLGLGQLIYLYSDNKITIEGSTDIAFTEDVKGRFDAMGWHVQKIDGMDIEAVSSAIDAAKAETGRPSLIIARTNIGFGSPAKQDDCGAHGSPLGPDEVMAAKNNLGWPTEPTFHIPDEALANFRGAVDRGAELEKDWKDKFEAYSKAHPEQAAELKDFEAQGFVGAIGAIPAFTPEDGKVATRVASGKVLNAIAANTPFLIGGSADLGPSNNTAIKAEGSFTRDEAGRNIHFGVREHAMGSVLNGMALSGLLVPYGGTFLVFSDYMKPAVRLAALMGLQVVYVFTHDSIGLGEDGPTHQPIEHLAALRSIPNLTVIRPADANETANAWRLALTRTDGPVALALTRQGLPILESKEETVDRGAYILADSEGQTPEIIIIATGSEVHVALEAYKVLTDDGVKARVVSMPSSEIFEEQDEEYRNEVLPPDVRRRISVEAASTLGWGRYVGLDGISIGLDRFGESAPAGTIFKELGFTKENIVGKARTLLGDKINK